MTTIGFDLDMTLIDSRPGIRAAYEQVVRESGIPIDVDVVVSRLGPPLETELAQWMPVDDVPRWADRYRAIYPEVALPRIRPLDEARNALEDARRRGCRTIVITAKNARNARLHVDHLGLAVDAVFGDVWRDGKARVLAEQGAVAYVGDHVHDMEAAGLAGVPGIGVTTGPCSAAELRAAGAVTVLDHLTYLEDALDPYL